MTIRAGANAIHTDADLQKQPIMLPRTMPREKPMASAPTIICHGITLSPLLRALIRSHVDALGRYGVWPSRFTVVVEMSGPELSAGYGVRTHVIIGGPGLQLSVLRTRPSWPVAAYLGL